MDVLEVQAPHRARRHRTTAVALACVLLAAGIPWMAHGTALAEGPAATRSSSEASALVDRSAADLAAGGRHTCAALSDGAVECWGYNGYGQLGDGTYTSRATPVRVAGIVDAVGITAGWYHTCTLLGNGTVQCWGSNGNGELGDGTTSGRPAPTPVSDLSDVIQLARGGHHHTCALHSDATVRCWGNNRHGQLGDGTTTNRLVPTMVPGLVGVVGITAGASHTCARLADGTVLCWGANFSGQLGDGTTTNRATPSAVPGISTAKALSAGGLHTCALLSEGSIRCWGSNGLGELGDGTTINRLAPVAVSGVWDAVHLTAGASVTCAGFPDLTAKCWGVNYYGQLGDGTTAHRSTPVAVQGLTAAVRLAPGSYHTCALLTDGTGACWGNNADGQLGDGSPARRATPAPVSSLVAAHGATVGGRHACALHSEGTVSCWGDNRVGQLGDGTTTSRLTPTPVAGLTGALRIDAGMRQSCAVLSGGAVKCWGYNVGGGFRDATTPTLVPGLSGAVRVAAGGDYTCGVLAGGGIKCWGQNYYGQLGDGTTTYRATPVPVSGISNAVEMDAGPYHACAVLSDGTVKCWGRNRYGELGGGTTTEREAPVSVLGLSSVVEVAVGYHHSCARLANGTALCWGNNWDGQLGASGNAAVAMTPVPVSGLTDAIDITAGDYHTCAALANGTARCWGDNDLGQLGDSTTTSRRTPVPVASVSTATAIAADDSSTCAVLANGTALCWGDNLDGQLGDGTAGYSTSPVLIAGLTPALRPSAPQDFDVMPGPGAGEVTLAWHAPASDRGTPVTAYRIYRGTASGALTFLAQVGDVSTFTDRGLPGGTTRFYRVSAVSAEGEGPRSIQVDATTFDRPSAPRGLVATQGPGVGEITLEWQPPADDGGAPVTTYQIHRGTASGSETHQKTVSGATTYRDTGRSTGKYFYIVKAVNLVGPGPSSNEASATALGGPNTAPGAPEGLTAEAGTAPGTVLLTWRPPQRGPTDAPPDRYAVYRLPSEGPQAIAELPADATRYDDLLAVPGAAYQYAVAAVGVGGEESLSAWVGYEVPAPSPIIFIHGIDAVGQALPFPAPGADGRGWRPMMDALAGEGVHARPTAFVGYYTGDVDADFFVDDHGGHWTTPDGLDARVLDGRSYAQNHPASWSARAHTMDTSIEHLAYHFAWAIHDRYQAGMDTGEGCTRHVDVVAHSMGGLVTRYALTHAGTPGFPERLCVARVVTLGTPFGGDRPFAEWGCPILTVGAYECDQMEPGSDFLERLGASRVQAPGVEPDWTAIGSDADSVVSAESATALPTARTIRYFLRNDIGHWDSTAYYNRMETEPSAYAVYSDEAGVLRLTYTMSWPVQRAAIALAGTPPVWRASNCGYGYVAPFTLRSGEPITVPSLPAEETTCTYFVHVPPGARSLGLLETRPGGSDLRVSAYDVRLSGAGTDACASRANAPLNARGICVIPDPGVGPWAVTVTYSDREQPFTIRADHS